MAALCSTPDNKKTSCESPGSHLPRLLTPHCSQPTQLGVDRLSYIAIELVLERFEGRERALVVAEERVVRTDLVALTQVAPKPGRGGAQPGFGVT